MHVAGRLEKELTGKRRRPRLGFARPGLAQTWRLREPIINMIHARRARKFTRAPASPRQLRRLSSLRARRPVGPTQGQPASRTPLEDKRKSIIISTGRRVGGARASRAEANRKSEDRPAASIRAKPSCMSSLLFRHVFFLLSSSPSGAVFFRLCLIPLLDSPACKQQPPACVWATRRREEI